MASLHDREHYKRRSKAWDHFVKKDAKKRLAECMYCNEVFCYSSTSANLLKHLERKHNIKNKDNSSNKEKRLETDYWEYYNRNEDEKKALCKLCSEEVDYEESSTAPLDHLKSKHLGGINEVDALEDMTEDDDDDDDYGGGESDENATNDKLERKQRNKTSIAWEYFDIEDDDKRIASCKLCGEIRSYRSTVTNLIRHLSRKHKNYESAITIKREYDGNETTAETDAEENLEDYTLEREPRERRKRCPAWMYFKVVNKRDKKSQCLICKKIISYSTTVTNLRQHLRRMHPHLRIPSKDDDTKTILLSANGEIYEVETDKNGDLNDDDQHEPQEMDTVYLEDFDTLENPPAKKLKYTSPPKKKFKRKPLTTIKLHDSSSDDETPLKNRTSDSIDHFGRYAASLLRELPKEIANKLQSDFITRIMDAQLTYETQKLAHARAQSNTERQQNAYSITVTSANNVEMEESAQNIVTEVVQSEI